MHVSVVGIFCWFWVGESGKVLAVFVKGSLVDIGNSPANTVTSGDVTVTFRKG